MSTVNDPFWGKDPKILIKRNRLREFIPSKEMSKVERLNAIARFSIYSCILLFAYYEDLSIIYVCLFGLMITYLLFNENEEFDNEIDNTIDNSKCTKPSDSNPFMNVMIDDYTKNPNKKKACDITDPKINKEVSDKFNKGLLRDVTDIYGIQNSQRQFFTVPGRGGVPDQSAFAHWLYRTPDTCKEGNSLACLSGAGTTGVMPKS